MRVAFLGSAEGYEQELKEACEFLHSELRVERIVYLGSDDALTHVEHTWRSASTPPEAESIWQRTELCTTASPDVILQTVQLERARLKVDRLSSVPPRGSQRLVLSPSQILLACHDREVLTESEVAEASVVVFGNSVTPQVRQFGARFFLSPGSFAHAGLLLLSTGENQLDVSVFNKQQSLVAKHRMTTPNRPGLASPGGASAEPAGLEPASYPRG